MYPYDFTKENYSGLGYLCEGVTTYQGDLFLLKSGVFSEEQYFIEFNKQLQKHFNNHGRFNYSVAASSFDTWLDGYEIGAPNRKVSIYTEGCLLAFVTDIRIREATKNKYGLDEVMKRLYFNFAMKEKGVSEADYQKTIEQVAGHSFQDFFDDYINGTKSYESILIDSLNYLGLELIHKPSSVYAESRLGMRATAVGNTISVTGLYPGGPAEVADVVLGDKIIAVNDIVCNLGLDEWLSYFDNESKTVTVNRSGVLKKLTFPEVNRNFYMEYSVAKIKTPSGIQKNAYSAWCKQLYS
jgi:predicted metalloprotease with PDZ domain